jgi:hypothetical protein
VNVVVILVHVGAHLGGHLQFVVGHRNYLLEILDFKDRQPEPHDLNI